MVAMRIASGFRRFPTWLALALLTLTACAGPAGRQNVDSLRKHYRATLLGSMVLPSPATSAAPAVNEQKDHSQTAPPTVTAEGQGLIDAPAATRDVELRVQIQHDSPVKLAALTLEVELLGPEGDDVERQHYRVQVDTSAIEPGPGGEVRSVLKEVPYTPGERFHVFVRAEVPARERALYSEFLSSR